MISKQKQASFSLNIKQYSYCKSQQKYSKSVNFYFTAERIFFHYQYHSFCLFTFNMKNIVLILTASCLLLVGLSQGSISLNQQDVNDPQFMKIVNNYFGCKTWTEGVCTQCSQNYYFNSKGICCQVKPQCKYFNRQVGICQGCYQGYEIVNGICVVSNTVNSKDKGCRRWNNGVCSECSVRWYFGLDGSCLPVDDFCRNWKDNGQCLECYNGYSSQNGKCIRDTNSFVPSVDSLCSEWSNKFCLKCAPRAFFDLNNICRLVDNNCNTWDLFDGFCLTCYKGYELKDGACVIAEQKIVSDIGCKKWDLDNKKCLECSFRWVFNQDGVCVPVNQFCASYGSDGLCTDCYKGYELRQGNCYQVLFPNKSFDLGCKKWDWDNQKCLECSQRWFLTFFGCQPIDDFCASYDERGACTSCYNGYRILNQVCIADQKKELSDLGCKTWDWPNNKCIECSPRWIFENDGKCIQVNDFCASHGVAGSCTQCYKGYNLINGECVLAQQNGPREIGCKTWNWDEKICIECSARWFLSFDGSCAPVNQYCADHDNNGACTACFKGYNLNNGECILAQLKGPLDIGCKKWDWDNQRCQECSQRWFFNQNGVCEPVNDNCASHTSDGSCSKCYKGYQLQEGDCVLQKIKQVSDKGCKTWDWDNQKCLECSIRWTFSSTGSCVPVDNNCQSFNNFGECTSCYKGYNLINNFCIIAQQNAPKDIGCKKWDWDNQICLECSLRWVFGENGCEPVDNNCAKHQSDGTCTVCYGGYVVINGKCAIQNLLCKSITEGGQCKTCYNGYALYKKQCIPLQKIANVTEYYRECCPQKLDSLLKEGRLGI